MKKRAFDTNILVTQLRKLRPFEEKTPADAESLARALIAAEESDAIVTPVEIEVLAGVRDRHELELTESFLNSFRVIDQRRILPADWEEARRLAKHIPRPYRPPKGRGSAQTRVAEPRDLGDCLITAITRRLNHDVMTADKGLRRVAGRTRRGKQ
jgi:predicted nucleic acid-binding protein